MRTIWSMNLKQLRKSKKLTQIQAAELCGLSRKGYQNLEEGKNKKKTSSTLLYCIARLEEYSVLSPSTRKLSSREIEHIVIPYFRSIGISFLYLLNEESVTLLGEFSLSDFDQIALENEIEIRLGKAVKLLDFRKATEGELKNVLSFGTRLYPKEKDN